MLRKTILAGLSLLLLLSLRTAGSADAAANFITADFACAPAGGVDVLVQWSGASSTAVERRLEVSLHNGWVLGTFASLPSVSGQSSLIASGLMPNAIYFVRVNEKLSSGAWDSSPTFFFRTPMDCALLHASPTLGITTTTTQAPAGGGPTTTPPGVGTGENCHPAYYGACLRRDAVDYDCQGGGGDGPDFIRGPVYLSGAADPFELDRDGDGIGCNE